MKTVETVLKAATGVACAYEAFSLATGITPTISKEVGLHWWIGPAVLAGLAVHFYWPQVAAAVKKLKGML